ncbi:hypothetical protein BKA70DRAFT_1301159 [Coprinopsis sp. MPI-PUGE-AT-0042]|nr:hypothetical protein BKA70DRAFT_1301159 [Coprinopsis sp. MPI-PUGE-AT-0042]
MHRYEQVGQREHIPDPERKRKREQVTFRERELEQRTESVEQEKEDSEPMRPEKKQKRRRKLLGERLLRSSMPVEMRLLQIAQERRELWEKDPKAREFRETELKEREPGGLLLKAFHRRKKRNHLGAWLLRKKEVKEARLRELSERLIHEGEVIERQIKERHLLRSVETSDWGTNHPGSPGLLGNPSKEPVPTTSFDIATPLFEPQAALSAPNSTAQVFSSASNNTIDRSNVKVAGGDQINLSVFINSQLPSHIPGQQVPDLLQTSDQHSHGLSRPSLAGLSASPLAPSTVSCTLSNFRYPFQGTCVTSHPPESATVDASCNPPPTQNPISIYSDPIIPDAPTPKVSNFMTTSAGEMHPCDACSPVEEGSPKSQDVEMASSDFEVVSLEDLDIGAKQRGTPSPSKALHLPKISNVHEIYVRNIYPSGHGYPCPNPWPIGPPTRIGDVGTLTSLGFDALMNLSDYQPTSLQSNLSSLPPFSDVLQIPEYLSEGESAFGGVSNCEISCVPESPSNIHQIKYQCQDSEGAILAVTSPAQLLSLRDHAPLRDWLCEHGMALLQSLRPGRADPLYVVTGTIASSSWAIATYAEPMNAPYDSLILTRRMLKDSSPQSSYLWTHTGRAQARSRTSTTIDSTGEKAKDQCLFLRGFLLTPSTKHTSRTEGYGVRNDGNTASEPNSTTGESRSSTNNSSKNNHDSIGEAGSLDSTSVTPSSEGPDESGTSEDVGVPAPIEAPEHVVVDEIPFLTSTEIYPSHMINKRLLELTHADLAVTHDDDWGAQLQHSHQRSTSGTMGSSVRRPSFLSDAQNAKMMFGANTHTPLYSPTWEDLTVAAASLGLSTRQLVLLTPAGGSHEKVPHPCTTFNNICQHLFGHGGCMEASEDPSQDGQFQAVSSVRHPTLESIHLGYGRGPTKRSAKNAAAFAACAWLGKQYPDIVLISNDNNFVLARNTI